MLDRKTYNIDASIELLKDRNEQDKLWAVLLLLLTFAVAIAALMVSLVVDDSGLGAMGISFLVIGYATAVFLRVNQTYRGLLIFLKREIEKNE